MSFLLALLAQVGPFGTASPQPVSPLPPEITERKAPPKPKAEPVEKTSEFDRCLADLKSDPEGVAVRASEWVDKALGLEKAQAGHCLGLALARLEFWPEAEAAFLAARDALGDEVPDYRARLGSMAGNAAMAHGDADAALAALDTAHTDAQKAKSAGLTGSIAMDRARALVALGRDEDAEAALAEARKADPGDAQVWLLSATLSRRMGKLAEAQAQIEKAADLLPVDTQIGLEAGRIAVLAGRDEAARKSWQSVIDAAPESQAADTARSYLAQLEKP